MTSFFRACAAAMVLPAGILAQSPASDSVAKLNHTGLWEQATQIARAALTGPASPSISTDERCLLRFGRVDAYTHMGALERATGELKTFDDQCTNSAAIHSHAAELKTIRAALELPPLPKTGLDFSGVDQFWKIADLLTRDREPTEAQWHTMFASVGYRLATINVETTRLDLEIALRPSRVAQRDTLLPKPNDRADRLRHLEAAVAHRAELARYRDSVSRSVPIQQAISFAARYLPPHATEGMDPPLVAFALFRGDAYSLGPRGVIIDLYHIYDEGGLTLLLAHEFHHSYLSALSRIRRPPGDDSMGTLVGTLSNLRNEGIADLIDKPFPVQGRSPVMVAYAKRYNEVYARTPEVIAGIDSALVVAADDSTQLAAMGRRVQELLPSAGHYNGSYIAREIVETFGVDSLFPGVSNQFAFLRMYAAAEAKRGNPPPFSAKTLGLMDELEKRYRIP